MTSPRRSRPAFGPDYGISTDPEGMLDWGCAEERLARSVLRPRRALAWVEREFPRTATRFDFVDR